MTDAMRKENEKARERTDKREERKQRHKDRKDILNSKVSRGLQQPFFPLQYEHPRHRNNVYPILKNETN